MGGWSYAKSVPREGHTLRYGLRVRFKVNNAWQYGGTALWNEEWSSWHMAAKPIVAPGDYTQVRVAIDYRDNYNTAQFDGIYLFLRTADS